MFPECNFGIYSKLWCIHLNLLILGHSPSFKSFGSGSNECWRKGSRGLFWHQLDILTEQFKNLTLTLNKNTLVTEKLTVFCFCSQKEGHYSNQCCENPTRTVRCGYCHQMGHPTDRCFQNRMAASKAKPRKIDGEKKEIRKIMQK